MKKTMIFAAMMTIAISASAAVKNSWPTNASKYPTTSWPVAKYPATPKFPKFPVEPGTSWPEPTEPSWPAEPVASWPVC